MLLLSCMRFAQNIFGRGPGEYYLDWDHCLWSQVVIPVVSRSLEDNHLTLTRNLFQLQLVAARDRKRPSLASGARRWQWLRREGDVRCEDRPRSLPHPTLCYQDTSTEVCRRSVQCYFHSQRGYNLLATVCQVSHGLLGLRGSTVTDPRPGDCAYLEEQRATAEILDQCDKVSRCSVWCEEE